MLDIIIPSCKDPSELKMMVGLMKAYDKCDANYIVTGFKASAATNRNYGLYRAKSDIIIMMDDDMGGFFPNWQETLVKPLLFDKNIKIVSARLLTSQGALSPMMGSSYNLSKDYEDANKVVLSACIAFRRADVEGIWFDERFIGSGFEDTDFCFQLMAKHPRAKFVINNRCQLIHFHEMKNQASDFFRYNRAYFTHKWGQESLRKDVPDVA